MNLMNTRSNHHYQNLGTHDNIWWFRTHMTPSIKSKNALHKTLVTHVSCTVNHSDVYENGVHLF